MSQLYNPVRQLFHPQRIKLKSQNGVGAGHPKNPGPHTSVQPEDERQAVALQAPGPSASAPAQVREQESQACWLNCLLCCGETIDSEDEAEDAYRLPPVAHQTAVCMQPAEGDSGADQEVQVIPDSPQAQTSVHEGHSGEEEKEDEKDEESVDSGGSVIDVETTGQELFFQRFDGLCEQKKMLLSDFMLFLTQSDMNMDCNSESVGGFRHLGLPNLLQTCYMNSVLQGLFAVHPFMEDIHKQQEVWDSNTNFQLFSWFALISQYRLSDCDEEKVFALTAFKETIATFHPSFYDHCQKDAHELLNSLLNIMKDMNSGLCLEAQRMGLRYICPINAHIAFKMSRTRTCRGCGERSQTHEDFLNLTLPLIPGATVSRCLQALLEEYDMDCTCDCGAQQSASICAFSSLPNVLIVQLQRFSFSMETMRLEKVSSSVAISTGLEVVPESGITEQARYRLVSVISHIGRSDDFGHYVCDGAHRAELECWLTYNDSSVTETTLNSVCSSRKTTAYLLFYQKLQL